MADTESTQSTLSEGERRPAVDRAAWRQLAACTAVATLLQLDGTIVTVALPSAGGHFGTTSQGQSWILTAYFATYAIGLLPGGRVVDRFGPRLAAVLGLAVFAAGTLMGALAGSLAMLIASRVVQGVGAGLASPAALTGAVGGFPPKRRGTALGIWGAASGLANLVGPLVGGLLTAGWGWRANWWTLLVLGLLAITATLGWVRLGATASSPSAGAERTAMRTARAASVTAALTFAMMIGTFFAIEQYLQQAAGYGALPAAAAPMVLALFIGAASPVAGRTTDRYGERGPALCGFLAAAAVFAVYALPALPLHGPALIPGGVVLGFALGLLFPSTSRAALNSVPETMHGRVSAQLSGGRLVGAAAGVALAGWAFRQNVTADRLHWALVGGAVLALAGTTVAATGFRSVSAAPQ
ncbi:MFS transporter [Streptantibioticus ferralitis]|uniref:MFS transporter n=1 Tax=Streptantibioticus ferralitis TaxID=236510 RepID=A0ABT5YWQ0_9ACTN|nr:MFS transporter [Streptantibioticus ferralitis]MDF2256027.1 MFS transporter [Streptantibioticus ferralitis]